MERISPSYRSKVVSAERAVALIVPGSQVFIGTACASPRTLVAALEAVPRPPAGVTLLHFLTQHVIPIDEAGQSASKYRHVVYFVGAEARIALRCGQAEYVPIAISRVPELLAIGRIRVDFALIQVSAPDAHGYVSLGVSVDVVAAAVRAAKLVIAEVNPAMPWAMGDATIHLDDIDRLVLVDTPVAEYVHSEVAGEVVTRIARYIASLIDDGATLQIGLGRVPNEALRHLRDRRDLGIHSDVITDAVLPLLDSGVLTGRRKTQHRGKIVASFAMGTRALYDLIDRNPLFSFQPIDAVCQPAVIAAQHRMVSVTQAFAIDLTGQVCSDQFAGEFYGGVSTQADFLRGASRSPGGKAIVCLASTTDDGLQSRIRPQLLAGEGVTLARADVHYVVTEFGVAYLFGLTIRQRVIALVQLAHPRFRADLLAEAKRLGYVPEQQQLTHLGAYPVEEERCVSLKNGQQVMLRPSRASDEAGIRQLFYGLSDNDVYTRFFRRVRALSDVEVQRLCNFNDETDVGFVAVVGPREQESIVGQSCYFLSPSTNLAETAFLVDPAWQNVGLGGALQRRMVEHAQSRGIRGFTAGILPENRKMLALARGCSDNVSVERDEDEVHITMLF